MPLALWQKVVYVLGQLVFAVGGGWAVYYRFVIKS